MTITIPEVNRSLVRTLDKRAVTDLIRAWRKNDVSNQWEANVLTDLLDALETGEYDG